MGQIAECYGSAPSPGSLDQAWPRLHRVAALDQDGRTEALLPLAYTRNAQVGPLNGNLNEEIVTIQEAA
jgi:hypothetical protein